MPGRTVLKSTGGTGTSVLLIPKLRVLLLPHVLDVTIPTAPPFPPSSSSNTFSSWHQKASTITTIDTGSRPSFHCWATCSSTTKHFSTYPQTPSKNLQKGAHTPIHAQRWTRALSASCWIWALPGFRARGWNDSQLEKQLCLLGWPGTQKKLQAQGLPCLCFLLCFNSNSFCFHHWNTHTHTVNMEIVQLSMK